MSLFYYNLLSSSERKLYMDVYATLKEGSRIAPSSPAILGASNIGRVIEYVKNDHPELAFPIQIRYTRGLSRLVFYENIDYVYSAKGNAEFLNQFKEAVNKYCRTDYEKVLYVHDFVINSVEYDHKFIETQIPDPSNHTALGVLDTGKGVCEGIARLTQLLLEAVGVEALYCEGKSKHPTTAKIPGHAWNAVRIDGKYCYLDVSNDVCLTEKKLQRSYCYFCLPYREIAKDRIFDLDREFRALNADTDEYSYFKRNGCLFSSVGDIRKWLDRKLAEALSSRKDTLYLQFKVDEGMLCDRSNSWEALCLSALYGALDSINASRRKSKADFDNKYSIDSLGTVAVKFTLG